MRVRAPVLHMLIVGTVSVAALLAAGPAWSVVAQPVAETNLVTDSQAFLASQGFTPAATEDPNFINPWGVSFSPTSPFWISDQGAGVSTLYNGAGAKQALTVTVPGAISGPSGPTGQFFNSTSSFQLPTGGKGLFFFAGLDGSISGWNPAQGTNAVRVVNPRPNALFTGLTTANNGGQDFLYVANPLAGFVGAYTSGYAPVIAAGAFVDPGPNPGGLVPFNVANIGNQIWVTYAPAINPDEAALGTGFVSVFNPDGSFVRRFATGGNLLSPWGITRAPASFGAFGSAILIGNFSDSQGYINAFRESDGAFLGSLANGDSPGLFNMPYLWSLAFGSGGNGSSPNALYFTAGIGDEAHGLFGQLVAVPEPAEWALLTVGFGFAGWRLRRSVRVKFA